MMRKFTWLALVLLAAGPALAQPPQRMIAGGWEKTTVDADVRQAARTAMTAIKIKQPKAKLAKIASVEMQVVAGLNYRMNLALSDKSRWEAVVWKHLDQKMEVTALTPVKDKP